MPDSRQVDSRSLQKHLLRVYGHLSTKDTLMFCWLDASLKNIASCFPRRKPSFYHEAASALNLTWAVQDRDFTLRSPKDQDFDNDRMY